MNPTQGTPMTTPMTDSEALEQDMRRLSSIGVPIKAECVSRWADRLARLAAEGVQAEARGVVGELVQMGDDEDGHPRLIINTTREAIKASNLVPFSQVEVRNG